MFKVALSELEGDNGCENIHELLFTTQCETMYNMQVLCWGGINNEWRCNAHRAGVLLYVVTDPFNKTKCGHPNGSCIHLQLVQSWLACPSCILFMMGGLTN